MLSPHMLSFWFGIMQDTKTPAQLACASTAVLLQAAVADPNFIQAQLSDSSAWPALLAACRPGCSLAAQQHHQLLTQLDPCWKMLETSHGTVPGAATRCDTCAAAAASPDRTEPASCDQSQHAAQTGNSCSRDRGSKAEAAATQRQLAAAGTAGHVAQLITLFLQTDGGSEPDSINSGYATKQALDAMLHCYVAHAQDAAAPLIAPVWALQRQCQTAEHSTVQHVADAGGLPWLWTTPTVIRCSAVWGVWACIDIVHKAVWACIDFISKPSFVWNLPQAGICMT